MTQQSKFWDGTTVGDATLAPYDAATEFARVMQSVSGAGGVATNQSAVFRGELNELAATGAATPVSINTGRAITAGTWYENDAASTVAIPTPAALTRIDRIVLRKDWSAAVQTVRITRIAGAEGGAAPGLTQVWGTTWDEPLAQVSIDIAGVITLTDQRQFVGNNAGAGAGSTTGQVLNWNGTNATWTSQLAPPLGSVGAPTYSYVGDLNTGMWSPAADTIAWSTGGVERARIDSAGNLGVGTTFSNAFMTTGLTIQQGGNDNEILALKSTDVSHGMTTITETDTYATFKKANATQGGLDLIGLSGGATHGIALITAQTTPDTTKSTAAEAAGIAIGYLKSGTTVGNMGATDNIFLLRNGSNARFIFQGDGTSYEDVGTAWVNYDDHNDVELLTDLSIAASRADDAIHKRFASFLRYSPEMLQAMDLIHFNADGHHFANRSKIQMALIGASRQLGDRVTTLERENQELRNMLALA